MPFQSAPFPNNDPLVDTSRLITREWIDWFTGLISDIDAAPARLQAVHLENQTAAIAATPLATGSLAAGLYRVSWYARITTPGTVSSSLTVSVGHTESGNSLSQSGAAMTGNTTGEVKSGSFLVYIDNGTPITYSTAYASSGATAMVYRLDVMLEQVNA